MRFALRLASLLFIPVALVGAVLVAFAAAGLYMVLVQGVAPGEPIWMDELAPSTSNAVIQIAIGAVLVAISLSTRTLIRRKLQS